MHLSLDMFFLKKNKKNKTSKRFPKKHTLAKTFSRRRKSSSHFSIKKRKGGQSNPTRVYGRFYADWCGYCRNMATEWAKIVNDKLFLKDAILFDVKDNETKYKLSEINKYASKGGEVKVEGYPTIFKIVDGAVEYYKGEKTSEKLKEWFQK